MLLNQGTEAPFCGTLLNNKQAGIYACRLCGLPLFKADAKFESGTGWPSFYQPFDPDHVAELGRRQPRHGPHGDPLPRAATATSATSSTTARRRRASATA